MICEVPKVKVLRLASNLWRQAKIWIDALDAEYLLRKQLLEFGASRLESIYCWHAFSFVSNNVGRLLFTPPETPLTPSAGCAVELRSRAASICFPP